MDQLLEERIIARRELRAKEREIAALEKKAKSEDTPDVQINVINSRYYVPRRRKRRHSQIETQGGYSADIELHGTTGAGEATVNIHAGSSQSTSRKPSAPSKSSTSLQVLPKRKLPPNDQNTLK